MNSWILVIVLTMWAGILHYMYRMNKKLDLLENELSELKKEKK